MRRRFQPRKINDIKQSIDNLSVTSRKWNAQNPKDQIIDNIILPCILCGNRIETGKRNSGLLHSPHEFRQQYHDIGKRRFTQTSPDTSTSISMCHLKTRQGLRDVRKGSLAERSKPIAKAILLQIVPLRPPDVLLIRPENRLFGACFL